ncbi:DUF6291 domain-containing protein [uncultured Capnocytophaga sp.]|uniref:DUF6291 domain-containing protein n=1 Tax=uncultured Capnocytophaga sp. TaxID=159273 RepID=UPI00261D2868|nr:DUF6291 domain-containing protein [uncultured Capnocytophaga sp.]
MKKETFLFYADWLNVIRDLPSEVQLEVYQAIAEYAIYDNLIELKPLAKVAFGFVKQTIDRDTQKYISISEKRSEAGKKGGRRLKDNELEESNEKQKKQLLSEKSKKSNCPLNDNDNVNDNDISFLEKKKQKSDVAVSDLENENSESPIETIQTPKEQSGGGRKRFTIPTPEEVQAYCDERKNEISGQQFCDFYSSKGWKIGKEPMKDWKAAVRTWEMRRKDQSPSITQPQPQISTPKRIRFDDDGNEISY